MRIEKLKTLALAWLAASLVSSCAAVKPLEKDRQELAAAQTCCESYAQFHFKPLDFRETERIIINRESPVFQFDTGKSYFQAFSLPMPGKSYSIIVSSYLVEQKTRSGTSYVFSPVVMFLDADYRVTRKVDKGFAAVVNAGNSINDAKLEVSITINPRAANERFMVIYTTMALLNQVTSLKVYKYAKYGTIEDSYPVPNSPIGELQISLTSAIY